MARNISSFAPCGHIGHKICLVNDGSGNYLLPESTMPLPQQMSIYHQWSPVVFTWGQFHGDGSRYQSLEYVTKLHIKITTMFLMVQWINTESLTLITSCYWFQDSSIIMTHVPRASSPHTRNWNWVPLVASVRSTARHPTAGPYWTTLRMAGTTSRDNRGSGLIMCPFIKRHGIVCISFFQQ